MTPAGMRLITSFPSRWRRSCDTGPNWCIKRTLETSPRNKLRWCYLHGGHEKPHLLATFASITLGAFYQPIAAAPGDLDPTFGGGTGVVVTDIGSDLNAGRGVTLQSDGKIVVAGICRGVGGYDIAVARYLADGRLDLTFNGTGTVTTDTRGNDDYGNSVAVQRDGRFWSPDIPLTPSPVVTISRWSATFRTEAWTRLSTAPEK